MKIKAYKSSPHANGDSNRCLEQLLDAIDTRCAQMRVSCDVERIDLFSKRIAKCNACDACHSQVDGYCVLKDDMGPLYDGFILADVLVFASPVHWWGMSSSLKGFIDRLYALDMDRFSKKKVVLLLCFAGKDEKESGAWLVKAAFEEICAYTGMELAAFIGVCTAKDQIDEQKLNRAIDDTVKSILLKKA